MDAETKEYLDRLVNGLTIAIATQFEALRDEMRGEMGALRNDLRGEMGAMRDELRGEMGSMRDELRVEMGRLRDELRDFRIVVDERFRTLERGVNHFEKRITERIAGIERRADANSAELSAARNQINDLRATVEKLDAQTNGRIDHLHEGVLQQFRVLNERVGAIEISLAA